MQVEADNRRSHIYMLRLNQIDTGTSPPRCRCNAKRHNARRCWYFNGKGPKLIDSFYSYVLSNNFFYYDYHRSLIDCSVEEEERARKKKKRSPVFLPPDILMDIISRLPATSILMLRLVSRDWNAVSRDPRMLAAQISHAKMAHLAIHPAEGRQEVHLISTTDGPGLASTVFRLKPLPKDMVVVGSSNGILCLQEQLGNLRGRLFLYNPLLNHRLPLPMQHPILFRVSRYGFGFDQVRSEFKVVVINEYFKEPERQVSIHACVIPMVGGSLSNPLPWTLVKEGVLDRDGGFGRFCFLRNRPLTLLNGKLHCPTFGNRIVAFDIVSHEITYLDFFDIPNTILRIGVLGDRLFAITCRSGRQYADFNIWVLKDYGNPDSMTKEIILHQQCIVKLGPLMIPYMLNEHEIILRDSQKGVPYMVQHNPTLVSPSVGGIQRT